MHDSPHLAAQTTHTLGRILLGGLYFMAALSHIPEWSPTVAAMQGLGVPAAPAMLAVATLVQAVGGLGLLLGWHGRLSALALAGFTVTVTYVFHAFWTLEGPMAIVEFHAFLANVGLTGAMLMAAGAGSGPWSVDAWLARRAGVRPMALQAAGAA
ncbi:DoxX family protein [Roseomonas sp. NAR14]|uniref:DoxX family protein n=1 Tax=Roseomonas acroporae TaxID=2937791 RepID=A0A9X1YBG0_9PROT|nr:DoxX family protein [Roseomonas acroporae]MCK8787026.1 DoxX family protein [Roseomonas acroporae]